MEDGPKDPTPFSNLTAELELSNTPSDQRLDSKLRSLTPDGDMVERVASEVLDSEEASEEVQEDCKLLEIEVVNKSLSYTFVALLRKV